MVAVSPVLSSPGRSVVGEAYDAGTARWVAAAEPLYERLAAAIVEAWPGPALAGRTVLELGAGSGALTRVLVAAGAHPIAVDLSYAMLAANRRRFDAEWPLSWAGVAGDANSLPIRPGRIDVAAGAFVLSHLPDPAAALRAVATVIGRGGTLVTASFAAETSHPVAAVVDAVAAARGWQCPEWFARLRAEVEPLVDSPASLAALHRANQFAAADVVRLDVDLGRYRPAELVAWRMGLAHVGTFVAGLTAAEQSALVGQAVARVEAELGPGPHLVRRAVLLCSSTVAPHRRNPWA